MRSIPIPLFLVLALAGCPEARPIATDGGLPSSDAAALPFCRELYGHQVNAGGRLGIDRADWACPEAWADARARADACVAFLQIEASSECEVETCEPCP